MAKQKIKKGIGKPEDKQKALVTLMSEIDKQYGKGTVISGKDENLFFIDRISSGSTTLDMALNGGYPRGRLVEIAGVESAGKSTLCLHAVAECQKKEGICAYIDLENALDLTYAAGIGVNTEKLLINQPDSGEQAFDVIETLIRSGTIDLIVIDSVAAIVPQAELDGEMIDSNMALQARLIGKGLRKITRIAKETNTLVLFVNQYRNTMSMYGPSKTTCGGDALRYFSSQRIDIKRIEILEENGDKVGIRSRVKVVKNKVGAPFKEAEFNIIFGKGIDYYTDLLDAATQMNVINKGGAWYSYNGIQIGQGSVKAANYLKENLNITNEIANKLFNQSIVKQPQNFEDMMEIEEDEV